MEVHAPHEKVHTWRDFFVHVGIMTVGLFIALSLESLVEHVHHLHIVREARENIHLELENNHKAAQDDLGYLQQDIDLTKENIDAINAMIKSPKDFHGSLSFKLQFKSLDSAAWDTSRDTGALAYMPYKDVQGYADLYEDQKSINDQARVIFQRQTLAMTPVFMTKNFDIEHTAPSEIQGMLHETSATLISLNVLKEILQQLDDRYVAALKKD